MNDSRLMHSAAYASVATALLLVLVKLYAWLATGSVSLLSSLVDSGLDALVSLVSLLAVRYALAPPDEEHRFGHTGAEDLAALFQAVVISLSAIFVGYHAIMRFLMPEPLAQEAVGLAVMVFSIVCSFLLVLWQRHVVRKTGSVAIHADSFHYVSDILVNGSVIVALLLSRYAGWWWADPAIGLGIAAYILLGAWRIGRGGFDRLMAREFEEGERQKVEEIIRGSEGVLGMHDLKTRKAGTKAFIQCHVEMDGSLTLKQAHVLGDRVEERLKEAFPRAEVILHQDPHVPGKRL